MICSENSITTKIQKQVVTIAGYTMNDIHLNDQSCVFDEEDDEFYIKRISPLSACKTHYEVSAKQIITPVKYLDAVACLCENTQLRMDSTVSIYKLTRV